MLKNNPALAGLVNRHCSVPDVGPLTAATLAAHLVELGRWDSKVLTSLVGLATRSQGSGKRRGHLAVKGDRGLVRRTRYIGASAVVRYDSEMRCFHDRLRQRRMPGNVSVVPVMRKSLLQLNTVAGKGTPGHSRTAPGPLVSPRDGLTSIAGT